MSKIRVHELAKQLNIECKALIQQMDELGIKEKKHSNSLEENEIKKVIDFYEPRKKTVDKKTAEISTEKKPEPEPMKKSVERPEAKEMPMQNTTPAMRGDSKSEASGGTEAIQRRAPQDGAVSRKAPIPRHAPQRIAYSSDRPNVNRSIPLTNHPPRQKSPQVQGTGRSAGVMPPKASVQKPTSQEPLQEEKTNVVEKNTAVMPVAEHLPEKAVEMVTLKNEGVTAGVAVREKEKTPESTKEPRTATGEDRQDIAAKRKEVPGQQRPQGDRPAYGQRPQGDRPAYGQRPQGDRPAYGQRPQGDKPAYGQRPQGDRPAYGQRPQGDRPAYGQRPQGDRPVYGQRPQGDRPAYGQRPQGDKPAYGQRPQGDRPAYGQRPQGDRPAYGQRPQGDRPAYGQRPQGQGGAFGKSTPQPDRARGGKPDFRSKDKPGPLTKKPEKDHIRRLTKDPIKKDRVTDEEKEFVKPHVKKPGKIKSSEPVVIKIPQKLTLKELAEKMNTAGNELVKSLMKKGMMITLNQEIEFDVASEIALDYNVLIEELKEIDPFETAFNTVDLEDDLESRPPVVVVMGHVDHGKTSLLDAIRRSKVASGEAGGITQHIGAYTVPVNGKTITFLDTPGHEAFTAMRMRGAKVTDIAVLVVAADDGVMPQTIEAINHAKAAGVEIIVAINKIDKPSANPDRVKRELTEHGIITEDWGGSTISCLVSAANHTGIDQLLEMILLAAEMKELRANPSASARGTVIEASLDKGKGPVATVLVQNGTLNVGDPFVAGGTYGKIRAMMDDKGNRVKKATPSMPVEILGLPGVPLAGDMFFVAENEKQARAVADTVIARGRVKMTNQAAQKVSLDDLFEQIKQGNIKELNIIVKADVAGSVEAMRQSLEKLSNEEVRVRIIHGGVGAITESDVMLASTSNAIIIGFNVRPDAMAKSVADAQQVDLRLYRVIYNAIEDVQAAMRGMLDPIFQESVIGHAEIRQLFKATAIGTIGGSYVTDGKFVRNAKVRIVRDGIVVYEGDLESLKRFKDDVKEVLTGYECGLVFNKFNDIKEGDKVEAYIIEQIKR